MAASIGDLSRFLVIQHLLSREDDFSVIDPIIIDDVRVILDNLIDAFIGWVLRKIKQCCTCLSIYIMLILIYNLFETF